MKLYEKNGNIQEWWDLDFITIILTFFFGWAAQHVGS